MAKVLTLDIGKMASSFFECSRVFGLRAQLPSYQLCWLLNETLNLHLIRTIEDDVIINEHEDSFSGDTLFGNLEVKTIPQLIFPVYRYDLNRQGSSCTSSTSILLYANKYGNNFLLPEVKYADYILVFHRSEHLCEDLMKMKIKKIPEIVWSGELAIETIKSRKNLII